MYNLKGKCAVVTGGAAGIGLAIAQRLALEGCDIGILDRCADGAARVQEALGAAGVRAHFAAADVSYPDSVRRGVAELDRALGPIDILVNNAGILKVSLLAEMTVADWEEMFRVNVHGVFNCSQAVLPGMMARRCGRIINLASWKGKRGTRYTGAYSATKFAVIGYTESLAQEVGSYNITVNAICPGMVEGTEMMYKWQQTARHLGLPTLEDRLPTVPLGRPATVADIANMAAFLASQEAAYITGEAYNVTGGMWTN
jgi:NAD(P)-dependent dehydrogenase (short-subunit alcohol dehydrogenase family)